MPRPPRNPLDTPLLDAMATSIASDLIDGTLHVLDRRDLAERAAREGIRQTVDLAGQVLEEMAADRAQAGEPEKAAALREGAKQVRRLPGDLPSERRRQAERRPRGSREAVGGRSRPFEAGACARLPRFAKCCGSLDTAVARFDGEGRGSP